MSADDTLARLAASADPPHSVRAYVATVLGVTPASGFCSIDVGDGSSLDEVPYWGTAPAVGSTQLAFLFDNLLGVLTAAGGGVPTDPALPEPLSTVQNTDITITTSTRHQEPATNTRCSITNPHPTKRLLVHGWAWCWQGASSVTGSASLYVDVDPLGSTMDEAGAAGALMTPTHTRWDIYSSVSASQLMTGFAQAYYYVPPASTGTIFASGARVGTGCAYAMRGTQTTLVPIRYA